MILDTGADHNVFREFTAPIRFEQFQWVVGDWLEIYTEEGENAFDWVQTLSGSDLRALTQKFHFPISAWFIGYPIGTQNMREIDDYDDFLKSEAQIVVLILDNRFFDFYCKDHLLTHAIADKLRTCNVNWEYIDENDPRTRLSL